MDDLLPAHTRLPLGNGAQFPKSRWIIAADPRRMLASARDLRMVQKSSHAVIFDEAINGDRLRVEIVDQELHYRAMHAVPVAVGGRFCDRIENHFIHCEPSLAISRLPAAFPHAEIIGCPGGN